jgi:acyl carrier protein
MHLQEITYLIPSDAANDYETGRCGTDTVSQSDITRWLVIQLADQVGLDASEIDIQKSCTEYGLDSMTGVSIAGDLEVWLDLRLSPTLLWDYPSIERVSHYVMTALEGEVIEFGLGHAVHPIEVSDGALLLCTAQRSSVDVTATVTFMTGQSESDFSSPRLDSEEATRLLAQLDTLSDAEVDAMLKNLLAA